MLAWLKPFAALECEVQEQRDVLVESYGVEIIGHCEACLRLLVAGDKGNRPYSDDSEILYCAEHAMTFCDLKEHWERIDSAGDGDDEAESRAAALALVESHVANGGNLTDKITETL